MKDKDHKQNYTLKVNQSFGVCGFASALASLYEQSEKVYNKMNMIQKGHFQTCFIPEFSNYLEKLNLGNKILLTEIRLFTNTFNDEFTFASNRQLLQCTQEYACIVAEQKPLGEYRKLGVAMPPAAVKDYLSRIYKIDTIEVHENKNIICGLSDGEDNPLDEIHLFDGLKQWVYIDERERVFYRGECYQLFEDFSKKHKPLDQVIWRIRPVL